MEKKKIRIQLIIVISVTVICILLILYAMFRVVAAPFFEFFLIHRLKNLNLKLFIPNLILKLCIRLTER